MINIVSQSVLRRTASGPGKVVKNLIKGLDLIGYPYVINKRLDACERLWVHDDMVALSQINDVPPHIKVLVGPNLVVVPQQLPASVNLSRAVYIHPSQWAKEFWEDLSFTQCPIAVWPTGVDTDCFMPTLGPKTHVLVYFKQRTQAELDIVLAALRSRALQYTVIAYPTYSERAYRNTLKKARYVVWLGCHESQGIALQEALATDVPVLVCDVGGTDYWPYREANMTALTSEQISAYPNATSAEFFDQTCGLKVPSVERLADGLNYMERHISTYRPRDYVVNHLSLQRQARAFVDLYQTYFGLAYDTGLHEAMLSEGSWEGARIKGQIRAVAKDIARQLIKIIR